MTPSSSAGMTSRTAHAARARDRSIKKPYEAGWRATFPRLTRACEIRHDFVVEADEAIELGFEQPLLIAVHAVALRAVFEIDGGADAVALHALGAQLRHVGREGAHRRQRRNVVEP